MFAWPPDGKTMKRITNMPDELVDELRDVYREKRSLLAVIRHIQKRGFGQRYLGHEMMVVDTFRLRVGQMAWMSWWFEDPLPGQDHITDEELDEKMVPEIEKNRPLWDRPAASDDEPKS